MYDISNIHWFNISVFYGRDNWSELLRESRSFYSQHTNILIHCLLFLSEERGEHIQILFSMKNTEMEEIIALHKKVEETFQKFIHNHPSPSSKPFPYGKSIWHYYNNNSIVWNRFNIRDFGKYYINFAQKTSLLIIPLSKDDTSVDSIFSVCLYLCTKLTRLLEKGDIEGIITACTKKMVKESDNYESYHLASTYATVNNQIITHIVQTIAEYYQKEDLERNVHFENWYHEAQKIYLLGDKSIYAFHTLCSVICEHLGLRASHQFLIYKFIKEWATVKRI